METITRPTEEQMSAEGGVTMAKEEELGSPKDHAPNPPPDRPTVEAKVVQSVRKDIPPKKDRLEPLKIDMSKHFLLPPTSAQLSLQCLDCHIIFSDHKSKERHLKQSHPAEYEQCMLGDALFACYVCDRHFTCSSELMAHQRTHTEKQPFKCPICGEAFRRSSELTVHKKVHFGQHGYTCSDCGKPCKTLTLLKYHRRTHTGERPYVCKDCGKRFSMSKALQKHILTHTQEETEGTGAGGAATLTPAGDAAHVKRFDAGSPGKPAMTFSCSLCEGVFKTAKTRLQHMKLKHSPGREMARDGVAGNKDGPNAGRPVEQGLTRLPAQASLHAQVFVQGQMLQQIETLGQEQMQELISTLGQESLKDTVQLMGHQLLQVQMETSGQELAAGQTKEMEWTQGQIDTLGLEQTQIQTDTSGLEQSHGHIVTLGLEQTEEQTVTLVLEQTQTPTETFILEQTQAPTDTLVLEQTQTATETMGAQQIQKKIEILQAEQTQGQMGSLELDPTQVQMSTVVLKQTQENVELMQLEHSEQLRMVETGQAHLQVDTLEVGQTNPMMEAVVQSELGQVAVETLELELTQVQEEMVELQLTEVQVDTTGLDMTQVQVETTELGLTQVQMDTSELHLQQVQLETAELALTQVPVEITELEQPQRQGSEQVTQSLNESKGEGETLQKMQAETLDGENCRQLEPTQELSENTPGQEETSKPPPQTLQRAQSPCLPVVSATEEQEIQQQTVQSQCLPKQLVNAQIPPSQEDHLAVDTVTREFAKAGQQTQSRKMAPQGKSAKRSLSLETEREFPGHEHQEKEPTQTCETQSKAKIAKRSRSKKDRLIVRFVAAEKVKQSPKQKPVQGHQACIKDSQGHKKQRMQVALPSVQKTQLQKRGVKEKKTKKKEKSEKTDKTQALLQEKMAPQQVQQITEEKEQKQQAQLKKKKAQLQKGVPGQKQPAQKEAQVTLQVRKQKKQISEKAQLRKKEELMPPEKKRKKRQEKLQEKNKQSNVVDDNGRDQVKQQSLLLLKGHKQPQLKVYKLDPSKTQQPPLAVVPCQSQTGKPQQEPQPSTVQVQKHPKPQKTTLQQKKKPKPKQQKQSKTKPKRKQQQSLLLPSIPLLIPSPAISPLQVKPVTRKRKAAVSCGAGMGSPQARRALSCEDCGGRFSEVLALEEHKTAAHSLGIRPGKGRSDGSVCQDTLRTDGETPFGQSRKRTSEEIPDQGQHLTSLRELGVEETPTLPDSGVDASQNHKGEGAKVVGVAALGGELSLTMDLMQTPKGILGNTMHPDNFGMQVTTDWDMEAEMGEIGLGDRVERVSFPALNPSPSLTLPSTCLEGDEGKEAGMVNGEVVMETIPNSTSGSGVTVIGCSRGGKIQPPREECNDTVKSSKDCMEETGKGGALSGVLHANGCTTLDAAPSSPSSFSGRSPNLCKSGPRSATTDTQNHNHLIQPSATAQLQNRLELETTKKEQQVEGREIEEKNKGEQETASGIQDITSGQKPQGVTEEEIKEELLLEVDIVTVGDQSVEDNTSSQESGHLLHNPPQASHTANCQLEMARSNQRKTLYMMQTKNHDTETNASVRTMTSDAHVSTVSMDCSEIKQEEEEVELGRREGERRRAERDNVERSCRRRWRVQSVGRRRAVQGPELEAESDGCQVIYQLHSLTENPSIKEEEGAEIFQRSKSPPFKGQLQQVGTEARRTQEEVVMGTDIPECCLPASLEESSDEQIVFELESVTTSVEVLKTEEGMETEGEEGEPRRRDGGNCNSPSILLERFLTGSERGEGNIQQCHRNNTQVHRASLGFNLEASSQVGRSSVTLMRAVTGQVIKMEDYSARLIPCLNGPSSIPARERGTSVRQVEPSDQQQGAVQMFLVKEEDPLVLDEPQAFPGHGHSEITEEGMRAEGSICLEPDGVPLGDRESRDLGREAAASVSPLVLDVGIPGCGQCLFFRVKEEEREVALDPPEREHSLPVLLVSGASGLDPQPDPSQTDAEVPLVAELNPGSFPDSGGICTESVPPVKERVSVSPGCGPEDGVAEIEECEQDGERQSGTQQNMYVCTGQGDLNTEQQSTEELLEFLRQNPDTEPSESSDSEPEGEACAMACYLDNRSSGHISTNENRRKKQDCSRFSQSQGRPGGCVTQESGGAGGKEGRTPFEYFAQYLDWKTWEEIARCTPASSNTPSSVSAKEVAQFVGIHIAMGTLKFPDKKLYWQDLTRVPLIADAMTASRFDQLACKLRLACRDGGEDGGDGSVRGGVSGVSWAEGRRDQLDTGNGGAERPVTAAPLDRPDGDVSPASRRADPARHCEPGNELVERSSGDTPDLQRASTVQSEHSHNTRSRTHHTRKLAQAASDARTECHSNAGSNANDNANSNADRGDVQRSEDGNGGRSNSRLSTDPLWQVRGLLSRVQAGCQALTREGSYGVDQHLLHLGQRQRGRSRKNSHLALQCTFLVGAGGSVLDFDLSLDDSGREDVLRRMIPGSKESGEGLAFLCKEDLCTPAVLERLLVAGVRSAGRIGGEGARVGTGDEFVSSDGRLTLLRCPRGFVLTTLTKRQAQQVSLVRDLEAALKDAQLNRDLLELYRTPLSSSSPAQWPLAVFWHLTDLALVNSWLQFRKDRGLSRESRRNLMAFRLEVAKALIHGTNGAETVPYSAPPHPPAPKLPSRDPSLSPAPLSAAPLPDAATRYDGLGHWPEQLGEGEGARCRFGGCERTSRVRCLKCCVFLCISQNHNCFLKFHSQGSI